MAFNLGRSMSGVASTALLVASLLTACGGRAVIDTESDEGDTVGTGACADLEFRFEDGAVSPTISDGSIYWGSVDWGSGTRIWHHRPDVSGPEVVSGHLGGLVDIATGQHDGRRELFAVTRNLELLKVDIETGLAVQVGSQIVDVELVDDKAYVLTWDAYIGGVGRLGSAESKADLGYVNYPLGLTTDGTSVFFAVVGTPKGTPAKNAGLYRLVPETGELTRLLGDLGYVDVAVTASHVYWLEQTSPGAVWGMARTADAQPVLVATITDGNGLHLAADASTLVYTVEGPRSTTHLVDLATMVDEVIASWPEGAQIDVAMSHEYIVATARWEFEKSPPNTPTVRLFCR